MLGDGERVEVVANRGGGLHLEVNGEQLKNTDIKSLQHNSTQQNSHLR